jgi:hypothetical protein
MFVLCLEKNSSSPRAPLLFAGGTEVHHQIDVGVKVSLV